MSRDDELEKLEETRIEDVAEIKTERFNKIYFPEDFPIRHDDEVNDETVD